MNVIRSHAVPLFYDQFQYYMNVIMNNDQSECRNALIDLVGSLFGDNEQWLRSFVFDNEYLSEQEHVDSFKKLYNRLLNNFNED